MHRKSLLQRADAGGGRRCVKEALRRRWRARDMAGSMGRPRASDALTAARTFVRHACPRHAPLPPPLFQHPPPRVRICARGRMERLARRATCPSAGPR
eukprot:365006-Chlamydomonas_euryale.AAC.11